MEGESVPGMDEARAAGFVPLENYTGNVGIGARWPAEHALALPETRTSWLEGGDTTVWCVRSPWPGISVPHVLDAMWTWVERDHDDPSRIHPDRPRDHETYERRAVEVLTWDEQRVRDWLRRAGVEDTEDE